MGDTLPNSIPEESCSLRSLRAASGLHNTFIRSTYVGFCERFSFVSYVVPVRRTAVGFKPLGVGRWRACENEHNSISSSSSSSIDDVLQDYHTRGGKCVSVWYVYVSYHTRKRRHRHGSSGGVRHRCVGHPVASATGVFVRLRCQVKRKATFTCRERVTLLFSSVDTLLLLLIAFVSRGAEPPEL